MSSNTIYSLAQIVGVEGCQEVSENAVSCAKPHSWKETAKDLSYLSSGQFWPKRRGISWVNGSRTSYIVDRDDLLGILNAMETVKDLGIVNTGYSYGSIGRRILEFMDCGQSGHGGMRKLVKDKIGYFDCQPGSYQTGYLYDVQSCYWSLWSRLPSLKVAYQWEKESLEWFPLTADQEARRREVESVVATHKLLRNSLVGSAYGGEGKIVRFIRGQRSEINLPRGSNFAAASVVIRSAYELTRNVSEELSSVHSCVDSIIAPEEILSKKNSWTRAGLNIRLLSAGESVIYRPGCYRVGEKDTQPYRDMQFTEVTIPIIPQSLPQIHSWVYG